MFHSPGTRALRKQTTISPLNYATKAAFVSAVHTIPPYTKYVVIDGIYAETNTYVQTPLTYKRSSSTSGLWGEVSSGSTYWVPQYSNPLDVTQWGCIGDNATDNQPSLNAALVFAANNLCSVYIPRGTYKLTANLSIPTPASSDNSFDIYGDGEDSILSCNNNVNITYNGPGGAVYQHAGVLRDFQVKGAVNTAPLIDANYLSFPRIEKLKLTNLFGCALSMINCNTVKVNHCEIRYSGNSTIAQAAFKICTVLTFVDNYVYTSANAVAALMLDNITTGEVKTNALETSGIGILVGNVSGQTYSSDLSVDGNNLESCSPSYIDIGSAFSDTSVNGLTVIKNNGFLSGIGTTKYGLNCKQISGLVATRNEFDVNASISGCATYNFDSSSSGMFIEPDLSRAGVQVPWVVVNGVQAQTAHPSTIWNSSDGNQNIINHYFSNLGGATTFDNRIDTVQGGVYGVLSFNNGTASTVTRTLRVPESTGFQLLLIPYDSNTTLAHLGGSGTGKFNLATGAATNLLVGKTYKFTFDGSSGNWIQDSTSATASIIANSGIYSNASGVFANLTSNNTVGGLQLTAAGGLAVLPNTGITANSSGIFSTASGSPVGGNTYIQFDDSGSFGGEANLTWNKTSALLTVGNATVNTVISGASGLDVGNATVNASINSTMITVGVVGTTSGLSLTNNYITIGNSTSNTYMNSCCMMMGNSTINAVSNTLSMAIGSISATTVGMLMTNAVMTVGNSSVNAVINSSSLNVTTVTANHVGNGASLTSIISAQNLVSTGTAVGAIPLSVVGAASATANLFQVSNSGSVVFAINSAGVLVGNGFGLTSISSAPSTALALYFGQI